jgi:hypothetical protein
MEHAFCELFRAFLALCDAWHHARRLPDQRRPAVRSRPREWREVLGREREAMITRAVSPAEFAVRFGLEPVDVEWLMGAYHRGMSEEKLRGEIQALGCCTEDAQRLLELIARRTARAGQAEIRQNSTDRAPVLSQRSLEGFEAAAGTP